MRTTLDIDDEVLGIVKRRAKAEGKSLGKVISEILKAEVDRGRATWKIRNGLPVLSRPPGSNIVVTAELVRQLLEETE